MPNHQFNHFTGRLTESKRLIPLYPIAPIPLESAEPPQIMFDTLKTKVAKTIPALGGRQYSSENRIHPKNLEFMKKLQSDLTSPVYLAKGMPDKILFGFTCVLISYGMFESFKFLWMRATKRI